MLLPVGDRRGHRCGRQANYRQDCISRLGVQQRRLRRLWMFRRIRGLLWLTLTSRFLCIGVKKLLRLSLMPVEVAESSRSVWV